LRAAADSLYEEEQYNRVGILRDAANHIESIRAENERLRLLLEEVAKVPEKYAEFLEKAMSLYPGDITSDGSKLKEVLVGAVRQVGDLIAFKLHPHPMTQKETDK
jgi:hypothetical protein